MIVSRTNRCLRFVCLVTLGLFVAGHALAGEEEMSSRQLGDDRFLAGSEVSFRGEIAGDAIAAGEDVELDATVRGDVVVAGGEVEVSGLAADDLYAAGRNVRLDGRVAGNARIAGAEVALQRGASIDGGASLAGGKVRMEGHVGKYLQIAGGELHIDGAVDGDVEAAGGKLAVGPATVIRGALTFRGPDEPRIAEGAQIRGGVKHIRDSGRHWGRLAGVLALVWLVGWLLVGAVLVALWPGFSRSVSATLSSRPGMSLLLGVVVLFCVPLLIALFVASLVGIPLALLLLFVYLLLLPLGYLATALTIAEWALARMRKGAEIDTRHRVLALLGVLVVLFFVTQIPFLGGLLGLVLLLLGIGALVLAATARHRGATPATGSA